MGQNILCGLCGLCVLCDACNKRTLIGGLTVVNNSIGRKWETTVNRTIFQYLEANSNMSK